MYLCTNKGKNMTKITIKLIIPILRIRVLRPAMSTKLEGAVYMQVHNLVIENLESRRFSDFRILRIFIKDFNIF